MRKLGRQPRPRALALKALRDVRLAKMAIARLKYRVSASQEQGAESKDLLVLLDREERLLEYISVKLEIYAATGIALTEALGKTLRAAGMLRSLAPLLPPHTAAILMEVEESLRGILAGEDMVPLEGHDEWVGVPSGDLSEEVRRVLEEAEAAIKARARASRR